MYSRVSYPRHQAVNEHWAVDCDGLTTHPESPQATARTTKRRTSSQVGEAAKPKPYDASLRQKAEKGEGNRDRGGQTETRLLQPPHPPEAVCTPWLTGGVPETDPGERDDPLPARQELQRADTTCSTGGWRETTASSSRYVHVAGSDCEQRLSPEESRDTSLKVHTPDHRFKICAAETDRAAGKNRESHSIVRDFNSPLFSTSDKTCRQKRRSEPHCHPP